MEGIVLSVPASDAEGVIRCTQGNRYAFSLQEWRSPEAPQAGQGVDFVAVEQRATQVFALPAAAESQVERPAAAPQAAPVAQKQTSSLAVVSLIFSIVAFFGLFFIGSLIGVICGHMARSAIRQSDGKIEGDGMALGGLILGYIGLGLALLFFLVIGAIGFVGFMSAF